ncbi:MAG TPA: hypothetical protein VKT75_06520 [Acidobacteriaceae bacterium]|nr:hypothetical protein [Acidobacteriaceae bacterium]
MEGLMHALGYEALLIALPLLLASYGISFLLVIIRSWAFAEGRKVWTQPRAFVVSGLLVLMISYYIHWIVLYAGVFVADLHRALGLG